MDPVDEAQEREAATLAAHIESQVRAAALAAPGSVICADCGTEIPPERRRAMPSAIRCIDCQAWFERLKQRT